MQIMLKKKKYLSINDFFTYYEKNKQFPSIDFVYDLVDYYRVAIRWKNVFTIEELLTEIENNPKRANFLKEKLLAVFSGKRKTILLTDAGLLGSLDFFRELRRRISYKIVPDQPSQENIQYVLNQVFHKPSDYDWLEKIPTENWCELLAILEIPTFYEDDRKKEITKQILLAILILSQRMGGLALQTDVRRMVPEYATLESPFIAIDNELNHVSNLCKEGKKAYLDAQAYDLDYRQVQILANQCEEFVNRAMANSAKYGISFHVNQTLLLIQQQIRRIRKLTEYLFIKDENDKKQKNLRFFLILVKTNSKKNNIRKLINDSIYNVTYEITNYTGKNGEHYITESSKEYFNMFKTALGGGFIVGVLCLIKLYLSTLHPSEFMHAVGYSLNYGLGFVTIYLTGATLATKQPAMTASTIAKSLEDINMNNKKEKIRHYGTFSTLFARVFRSQFIAFAGNVLFAFPTALLLVFALTHLTGYNMAEDKSVKLLAELNVLQTPVIFHSFIAGIFLFLSGIIAGNVANINNFNNFYYRLSEHPFLKSTLGKERMAKIAHWMQRKWPGVVSNMWFGVFMGSTAVVGTFLGLNLDIRHITFASGNFALGLFGADFNVTLNIILWSLFGIFIIGLVNFTVSFSLSLLIALRSREIPLTELRDIMQAIWKHFRERPLSFFIPIKTKGENIKINKAIF